MQRSWKRIETLQNAKLMDLGRCIEDVKEDKRHAFASVWMLLNINVKRKVYPKIEILYLFILASFQNWLSLKYIFCFGEQPTLDFIDKKILCCFTESHVGSKCHEGE